MAVEGIVVRTRALFVVGDKPELAMRLVAREMLDATLKHGLLRRSGAREFQCVAGKRDAAGAVRLLKGSE